MPGGNCIRLKKILCRYLLYFDKAYVPYLLLRISMLRRSDPIAIPCVAVETIQVFSMPPVSCIGNRHSHQVGEWCMCIVHREHTPVALKINEALNLSHM